MAREKKKKNIQEMEKLKHQLDLANGMIESMGDNELLSDIIIAASIVIARSINQAFDEIHYNEIFTLLMNTVAKFFEKRKINL